MSLLLVLRDKKEQWIEWIMSINTALNILTSLSPKGIASDSRLVEPGYLFVALPSMTPKLSHSGGMYIKEAINRGADIVKLATTTNTITELINLFTLLEKFSDQNIAVMGMGKYGKASRLIAAQSGSILNYVAVGSAKIDGQWKLNEFSKAIKE